MLLLPRLYFRCRTSCLSTYNWRLCCSPYWVAFFILSDPWQFCPSLNESLTCPYPTPQQSQSSTYKKICPEAEAKENQTKEESLIVGYEDDNDDFYWFLARCRFASFTILFLPTLYVFGGHGLTFLTTNLRTCVRIPAWRFGEQPTQFFILSFGMIDE